MEMLEAGKPERDYALERLIMLSDGVFAIAITLLALELRPPEHWDGGFQSLMNGAWRPLLAFVVSFLIIASYWINHRRMFGRFKSADIGLTIANFFLLAFITLVPVVSSLVTEGGPSGAGFAIYVGLVAAIGLSNTLLWLYAALVKPHLFTEAPPFRAVVVVAAVMLIPTVVLPVMALVSAGRAGVGALVIPLLIVAGIRLLRVWAGRQGVKQWMP